MDWTMVHNAKDRTQRIQTLVYLLRERYQLDAKAAGSLLARDSRDHKSFRQIVDELRAELASPSVDLVMLGETDSALREYLSKVIEQFDAESNRGGSRDLQ
jgi:hypothetical protein